MNKGILITSLTLLTACGCTGMNNTQQGAVTGGLFGTGAGALVGHATGHTGLGALIGGLFGTGLGAAVGRSEDRAVERQTAREIAYANDRAAKQMRLEDVIQLSQQKTPDQLIVNQINNSGSRFDLRAEDIMYLRQNGVSDHVISVMQVRSGLRQVVVEPRPIFVEPRPVERVVIVEQPQPYFGIRVGGHRHHHHHH